MKIRWHHQALGGLAIAAVFFLIAQLLGGQGYHTFRVFGSDFGIVNIKSMSFVVWSGETFRFPFDLIVFFGTVVGVSIAVAAAWSHFKRRRADASS